DANPAPHTADDLAWLFFTSGTTGTPKGAMITHGNLEAVVDSYLTDVDRPPIGASLIHFAPLSHGSGIYLFPFLARSAVSVCGPTPRMTPDLLFELIAHWSDCSMFAAPTIVQRMTVAARACAPDTRNLRTIVYCGGPLYLEDLHRAADVFGPVFAQIYGQGESPMTITVQSRERFSHALATGDDAYLSSVGQPFSELDVSIADKIGTQLPVGEVGEILVKGRTVVSGYWRDPDATARTIRDGWLRTGDLGRCDAAGCITLVGRSKETIITGGSNVYPIEVETVLSDHDNVAEVAVAGTASPEWGETVLAFIVPKRSETSINSVGDIDIAKALDAHCSSRLARFKCPKHYVFCDALPKNAYGKVDKRKLIADHAQQSAG
ncbi:MAG: AMP-binding protein, partial [Pseudomonadota bacterium]